MQVHRWDGCSVLVPPRSNVLPSPFVPFGMYPPPGVFPSPHPIRTLWDVPSSRGLFHLCPFVTNPLGWGYGGDPHVLGSVSSLGEGACPSAVSGQNQHAIPPRVGWDAEERNQDDERWCRRWKGRQGWPRNTWNKGRDQKRRDRACGSIPPPSSKTISTRKKKHSCAPGASST
eukprot:scaffold772_cov339-Pavlova_lutheri.AAC.71